MPRHRLGYDVRYSYKIRVVLKYQHKHSDNKLQHIEIILKKKKERFGSIPHTQLASDQVLFGFEVVTQWPHSDHFYIPNEEHHFHFDLVQGESARLA